MVPNRIRSAFALDLASIEAKLAGPKYRWNPARINRALVGYRTFLDLHVRNRESLKPVPDVDEVWHLHILNTQKYAADCQALFGHFLHHVPEESNTEPLTCSSDLLTCSSDVAATCSSDVAATCSSDRDPADLEPALASA